MYGRISCPGRAEVSDAPVWARDLSGLAGLDPRLKTRFRPTERLDVPGTHTTWAHLRATPNASPKQHLGPRQV